MVCSAPAGFSPEESFEEGVDEPWRRGGASLPEEPGGSVWQLQERSADGPGQYLRDPHVTTLEGLFSESAVLSG